MGKWQIIAACIDLLQALVLRGDRVHIPIFNGKYFHRGGNVFQSNAVLLITIQLANPTP